MLMVESVAKTFSFFWQSECRADVLPTMECPQPCLSLHFTSFRDVLEYGKLFVWCVVEKARRQEIDYMSSQHKSMEHGIDK